MRRLPYHRSLPILFWLLLARLLRWKPPVPQVRNRVIRYLPELPPTYIGLFGDEAACRVQHWIESMKAMNDLQGVQQGRIVGHVHHRP